MEKIRLLHLYPNELNLYADKGNLLCINYRLQKRGYKTEIIEVGNGDKIPPFDIMLIGGGQDREIKILQNDIRKKADALKYYIESESVILAICGGYQLLGEYYRKNEEFLVMSGALPFYTEASQKRMIGNLVFKTKYGTLVGFENHSGKTYLKNGLKPFGNVISGYGNNGKDNTEGLIYKNTFCTYSHGPFLPKNVFFCDKLISLALKTNSLSPIDDKEEELCHNQLIKRFT